MRKIIYDAEVGGVRAVCVDYGDFKASYTCGVSRSPKECVLVVDCESLIDAKIIGGKDGIGISCGFMVIPSNMRKKFDKAWKDMMRFCDKYERELIETARAIELGKPLPIGGD